MKEIVFEIPLLKELIACYLKPIVIKNCTLVSKQWNDWFTPVLWRTLTLKYPKRRKLALRDITGLISRHAQYIQSITLHKIYLLKIVALPTLPRLKSLIINGDVDTETLLRLIDFDSVTLRIVKIRGTCLDRTQSSIQFVDALKKVRFLNHLELSINECTDQNLIQDIITSHGHLETLKISSKGPCYAADQSERILPSKQTISQMEGPRIKILHLEFSSEYEDMTLMYPLIRRCTRLEELRVSSLGHPFNFKPLTEIIKEGGLNHLKSLYCDLVWPDCEDIVDLVVELGKKDCEVDINGFKTTDGIKELVLDGLDAIKCTKDISRYFSTTLTSLQLGRSILRLDLIPSLLSSLPLLQKFIGGYLSPEYDQILAYSHRMYFTSWTCLDMIDFEIKLGFLQYTDAPVYNENFQHRKAIDEEVAEYFFSQLCRLRKLRRLKLGAHGDCLNLKYGYLEKLSDLKDMRILDLSGYIYTEKLTTPSPMQVVWMVNYWPKLETIFFPRALAYYLNPTLIKDQKKIRNDATDTLRKIRPDIDIIVEYGEFLQGSRSYYYIE